MSFHLKAPLHACPSHAHETPPHQRAAAKVSGDIRFVCLLIEVAEVETEHVVRAITTMNGFVAFRLASIELVGSLGLTSLSETTQRLDHSSRNRTLRILFPPFSSHPPYPYLELPQGGEIAGGGGRRGRARSGPAAALGD